MSKIDRVYRLLLELTGGEKTEITDADGFTVEFEVVRQNIPSSQTASFRIHNLGERLRNRIYKDRFNTTELRAVQFYAGYKSFKPSRIFNGTIMSAYTERTDNKKGVVTVIEAYDGAYAMQNSFSSTSFAAGQTFAEAMDALAKDLVGVNGAPIIGSFPGEFKRGNVYSGNTWNYLVQLSGGLATIDNGQVKILQLDEALRSEIPLITAESGLLGAPQRSNTLLEFPMLLEPRLELLQIVQLQSRINSLFNGTYKVIGFTHAGVISPTESGSAVTTVSLWRGMTPFKTIAGAPL